MNIDLIVNNNSNLRPRDEIEVEDIIAAPYPDNRRVKVTVVVTPFRERPNLEIAILDAAERIVASTSAIALMNFRSSYVMHLRGMDDPTGSYTIRVQLYYESPDEAQHTHSVTLDIPPQNADSDKTHTE